MRNYDVTQAYRKMDETIAEDNEFRGVLEWFDGMRSGGRMDDMRAFRKPWSPDAGEYGAIKKGLLADVGRLIEAVEALPEIPGSSPENDVRDVRKVEGDIETTGWPVL